MKHYFFSVKDKSEPPLALEVKESMTVLDLHPLVATHWGLDPDTIRILQAARVLDKARAVTEFTSTRDKPLAVFGKLLAPSSAPADPRPSRKVMHYFHIHEFSPGPPLALELADSLFSMSIASSPPIGAFTPTPSDVRSAEQSLARH